MQEDSAEIVRRTASLARLEFTDEELVVFAGQFKKMLEYVSVIERLDLDGVEPMLHIIQNENVFREDIAEPSLPTSEALANAPKRNEVFFKTPKVLK